MSVVLLQGKEIHISGKLPPPGETAPDFVLVNQDLEDVPLSNFKGKNKIISIVPSLDTPVCATSAQKFNQVMETLEDSVCIVISADLPFAMARFCSAEKYENIITLSMMRSRDFARDYGVLIEDGPLAGITTRAILVLDKENTVCHTELVNEITNEPNYDEALKALKSI